MGDSIAKLAVQTLILFNSNDVLKFLGRATETAEGPGNTGMSTEVSRRFN